MSLPNSWFVQTGFGTILGPMPTDALSEMIRTGALIASDLVRTETSPEWEPATNVPGLFSDLPSPSSGLSKTEIEAATELSHATRSEQHSSVPIIPISQRPSVPTETVAYAFDQPAAPPPPQAVDLVAQWKAERQQRPKRRVEHHDDQSLAEQIERDISDTELEPIPDIFADEEPEQVKALATAPSDLGTATGAASQGPRQTIKFPSLLSQIAPDLPALPTETFARKRDRWMRSLPSKPIMATVIVLVLSAWWFWPRSQRPVYHRLVAIWTELQAHRSRPLDKSGMTAFVARAQSELDAIVPKLSKQAKSNSREATLLLRASRDCLQPMLKRPRERDAAREKQLDSHLQELAVSYGLEISNASTQDLEPMAPTHPAADATTPASTTREKSPLTELPVQPLSLEADN
ncbi:MAG: DUF4339 domain-containing protein [Planctomycetia bacterium]|nr:DUF4339 domain-containing protein [Planctomycetia bacterium]